MGKKFLFTLLGILGICLVLIIVPIATGAQVISRVSTDSQGRQSQGYSFSPDISADGRYIVFTSEGTDLVPETSNFLDKVYLKDTLTGAVTRIAPGDYPEISANGRFVAFNSHATDLVPGDDGFDDIFRMDIQSGTIIKVSTDSNGTGGNGNSWGAVDISADGRYVVFKSNATNLVPSDTNGKNDVFIKDTQTDQTTRLSTSSTGLQSNDGLWAATDGPAISSDGHFVAFQSNATNLVAEDTNNRIDIFVKDTVTNQTTMVSTDSSGGQGNGNSRDPAISADGGFVAFSSLAGNLVSGDTNTSTDVFLKNVITGQTTRVSTDSSGGQGINSSWLPGSESTDVSLSADARFIIFRSGDSNLIPFDTNGYQDIFVKDSMTGSTARVSLGPGCVEGNKDSYATTVSANGRYIAFESFATNLAPGDTNNNKDIYLADAQLSDSCGAKPQLTLAHNDQYWESYSDYVARKLSVSFTIENISGNSAHDVRVVGATATNWVTHHMNTPLLLGDISGNSSKSLTLSYQVPNGVQVFNTTMYATAYDHNGNIFYYPNLYLGS